MKKLLLCLMLFSGYSFSSLSQQPLTVNGASVMKSSVSNVISQSSCCKPTTLRCAAVVSLAFFCAGASYGYCAKEGCMVVVCMAHECLNESNDERNKKDKNTIVSMDR